MKEILAHLFEKNTLTKQEAYSVLTKIGTGTYSDAEIASFLTVYLMRKITAQELAGFREALLELCVPVDFSNINSIDVCGTGGDEKNTFNISTLSAFVLAGAGVHVSKHGNYAVSSASGSSNMLEHFGYTFSNNQVQLRKEIETAGITYLHAPLFHPAMKYVGPVRKSLKMKTFFNILGPMVNPSRPKNQLVGVFNKEVLKLYNEVFSEAGLNYSILHSLDGYDEISLTGNFVVASSGGEEKTFTVQDLAMQKLTPEAIFGGDTVESAAKIFVDILDGNGTEAQNNVVAANSAFALKLMEPQKSISDCIETSKESLHSGRAKQALKRLIELQ